MNALYQAKKEACGLAKIRELGAWQCLGPITTLDHLKDKTNAWFATTNSVVLIAKEIRLAMAENPSGQVNWFFQILMDSSRQTIHEEVMKEGVLECHASNSQISQNSSMNAGESLSVKEMCWSMRSICCVTMYSLSLKGHKLWISSYSLLEKNWHWENRTTVAINSLSPT